MKLMNIIQQKKVAEDTDQVAYNLTGYVDDKKDSNITHKDQKLLLVKIQKEH